MNPEKFCQSYLQKSVAQICKDQGWTTIHDSALELLSDVLERHITSFGKITHAYTEHYGRTDSNLDDLGQAFESMKIDIGDLQNFVQNADQAAIPRNTIAFPAHKTNNLQFPKPNSLEILHHRAEHIHEHLPPMFPAMEEASEQQETPALPQPAREERGGNAAMPNGTAPVTPGENRPAPASNDALTPGKRPRVAASNLSEEAGRSQYEMSGAIVANDGTHLGLNNRGRKPQPGRPPPPIRLHKPDVLDAASNSSRRVEGSDANAEADTASRDATTRTGTAAGKDGPTTGSGGSSGNKRKSETSKVKNKKKDKSGLEGKEKKQKKSCKESEKKVKITVGGKRPSSACVEPGSSPSPKKPKLKGDKPREEKSKKSSAKVGKIKKKAQSKKTAPPFPMGMSFSSSMANGSGTESCLKDLLLSPDKLTAAAHPEQASLASSEAHKHDLTSMVSTDSDLLLRQAFPPTDIFDSESGETSPTRLVIAEAEGRAQEKEEEKCLRLKNIDDTISAVIRDSAANFDVVKAKKPQTVEKPVPPAYPAEPPRKRGRPKKIKKSSEFIADDVISQEKDEEMGARSMKSINDTIDAVIRRGSEEPKLSSPKPVSTEPSSVSPVPSTPTAKDPSRSSRKEGKKKKAEKKKLPVKKKLKAKLHKSEKDSESAPSQTPVDHKPFVSDKFSNDEMKVFEFSDAESPPLVPERRPSQAEREPSPREPSLSPVPVTPLVAQGSFAPTDVKPVIKSPTPEAAVVPTLSLSSPVAPGGDQQLLAPIKIEIPKERHREKSRDKEHHRKDKKEKRRDKEKKKKNKDRERSRDRHDKHHHERRVKEETPQSGSKSLKLKIRLPPNDSSSLPSSKVITDSHSEAESADELATPKKAPQSSSPHRGLKMVIRHDATEGSRSQKKYSSVVSTPTSKSVASTPTPKSEPRNTPPTLHPASPVPSSPPAPILTPVRDRSPSPAPPQSPPATRPESHGPAMFSFTTSPGSPHMGGPSLSPLPRTPCFSPKSSPLAKTPSPKNYYGGYSGSPMSFSSPFHSSPVGPKSPMVAPRTPSLSPAYQPSTSVQEDQLSVKSEKSPAPLRPLFGTPEHDTAPSSPLPPAPPVVTKPVKADPSPPPVVPKPKGKVGRPRLKSPRAASPKGKSPKLPRGVGKTPKAVKAGGTGKPAGRGRPPKAKTLALREALAAAASGDTVKSKPKPVTPPPLEIKESLQKASAASSSLQVELEKSGQGSSSESPSPTQLSMAFTSSSSSKTRGTVETETCGSYFDSTTGIQIWICPACKLQDDGSPMIGCDKCDDWYHWVCVNITKEPPEEESWFCPRCSAKAKRPATKGKRGRKKKVH
ncbi:hypothetical protein ACOMHN_048451 [Nucella lapillus]